MYWAHWITMILMVWLAGCARRQADPWARTVPAEVAPKPSAIIVTPAQTTFGRITSVNLTARYVVVTYPVGIPMPAAERRLNVYRSGLKVAEVKAGGERERIDVNLVADILAGECQVGDEVRDN